MNEQLLQILVSNLADAPIIVLLVYAIAKLWQKLEAKDAMNMEAVQAIKDMVHAYEAATTDVKTTVLTEHKDTRETVVKNATAIVEKIRQDVNR